MPKKIGGNVTAELQAKTSVKNDLGEVVNSYQTIATLQGFLDFMSGNSEIANYNAKIQNSTHIFICDYQPIQNLEAEKLRMVINGKIYEIRLIDNPMELNYHYEFYLEFVGLQ